MPKLFISLLSPAVATDEGYDVRSAWMIQEDDGRIRARGETDFRGLAELIDPGTDWVGVPGNIVVTVPSEHVLSLSCEVPGRSVGQIRRALPFVVEEFVTSDIESMHLASAEIRRGDPVRVNLIERDVLDGWLACLASLDVRPGYLLPDAELLPAADREASLLLDGDRALIRTRDQAAALDRDNLPLAVSALDIDRLTVVHGELTDLETGQLAQEVELVRADSAATGSALEYVARAWRQADAINLLQGAYRPRQPVNPLWERWRPAAALAAVWVGVALVAMSAQAIYASYQADRLSAESEALYRSWFPQEQRVTNVRRQLQAKLGERSAESGGGLLPYLTALAAVTDGSARIQSLNFTGERNELAVDMTVGGFDALDQIKGNLAEHGVDAEITSAEQLPDGVRARMRLRGAGGAS
ncbi:MAG: type II secretion system protein GspL [Pseudomonadales bacterium]